MSEMIDHDLKYEQAVNAEEPPEFISPEECFQSALDAMKCYDRLAYFCCYVLPLYAMPGTYTLWDRLKGPLVEACDYAKVIASLETAIPTVEFVKRLGLRVVHDASKVQKEEEFHDSF